MDMDNKLTKDSSWLTIVKYKGDKSDLQAHIDELRDNGKTVFSVPAHYNNKGGSTLMLFIINEDRDTSKMVKEIMPRQATIISTELKEYY